MNDNEAQRHCKHPALLVRQEQPFNAEPPAELLRQSVITPAELFFSRNHAPLPTIEAARFRLSITGLVDRPLRLSLEALHGQFSQVELAATLLCAGNRRADLLAIGPIPNEVPWGNEAISTAVWTGVPLREVLLAAGLQPQGQHVALLGLDQVNHDDGPEQFGGSLPIAKAMQPEVLLAYALNGAPLPQLHGFPLRLVAPGYIGARSVKWLSEIIVQQTPSANYYQARAYRLFPPEATAATANWQQAPMLGPIGLNAVICVPAPGQLLSSGAVLVQGHAIASDGAQVTSVEVSPDGGATWQNARLTDEAGRWAWRFWEATLDLAPGPHQLVARAWDSSGAAQPTDARQVWNFKGYMNNAWHRLQIIVGD